MNSLSKSLLGGVLASVAMVAAAQEKTFEINIPAQPLASALDALRQQTGLHLFYAEDVVKGKTAVAVTGSYSAAQAVARLLAGSGLAHTFTASDTVAIKPPENGSDATTLPAVKVTGQAVYDTANPYNPYYYSPKALTATKTDTPVMETPASIQVIPKKIMDDQQAYNVKEAVKNVSGVQMSTSPTSYENFVIRGFDASGSVYKNGIRQDSFAEETANLQSIEVLKGPAGMLYGRIEPGGLINLQTVRPLDTPYYSLQQQFGSYDFYRTTLDATGPITDDKSLLYRLNFAYRDNKSFRDLSYLDRIFLAPSLTWRISDRTTANILLEYQNDEFRNDYGFPAVGRRPANLPINRSLGDVAAHDGQESQRLFTDITHEFNDNWKLTHRFMVSFAHYTQYDIFTNSPADTDTSYTRALWGVHNQRDLYGTNLELTGKFDLGISRHNILVGTDYYQGDHYGTGHCCDAIADVNSLNPLPTGLTGADLEAFPTNAFFTNLQEWNGVYFQDQITLWDKLHILGGGRHDWLSNGSAWVDTSLADAYRSQDATLNRTEKFSPRVGVLYQPWQWLSVYGNYTESLGNNNSGIDRFNKPLATQTAEQLEAGFKTEFFDKRLSTSVAYFHITKQNIATPDLETVELFDRRAIGEVRSQGIEIDVNGNITDDWNVIATYAYTDTKITKDDEGNLGNQLPNAARDSGSLWTTYDLKNQFAGHWFSGLNLGTGVFVVGERQGIIDNSFQLPGYVRWDASAAYKWQIGKSRLTAQLNVRNILDQRYFAGADTYDQYSRGYGNIPGEPLTFLGSIKVEY